MQYEIMGNIMPVVEMTLEAGEAVYTQSGGMVWMSTGITMDTSTRGGLMKGLGRMFAGESVFMATYQAQVDGARIAFASTVPGRIVPIDLTGTPGIICQKGAFLCAENSVELNVAFTKKVSAGFFGGEGFVLQDIRGSGKAFLEVDGDLVIKELAPGQVIKVDTGNVVGFDKTIRYEIESVKGFKNIFLGGEGLFLTKLTGPGKVMLQSMNFSEFAGKVNALFPRA